MVAIRTISSFVDYINVVKQPVTGAETDWFPTTIPTTDWQRVRSGQYTINPVQVKARPDGETVGNRDVNSQIAVPGRRYSEGTVPTVWRADTGALFALAALGAETVSEDPASSTRYKHVYRCADTPPWLMMDAFQGAEVSNAKQVYRHRGVGLNEATWAFDANDDAGLLSCDYAFLAHFYELVAESALEYTNPTASAFKPIAAWKPVFRLTLPSTAQAQDNYFTAMSLTFSNGIERLKSAVNEQDDQGQVHGGRAVTATLTRILKKGDTETFANLSNTTDTFDLEVDMTGFTTVGTAASPNNTERILFHIPKAEVNAFPARAINAMWKVETINITGIRDDTIGGPIEITVWNNRATAY